MSQLLAVLTSQLNQYGNFTFFGSDGTTVIAHDLSGVYSLEVIDPEGNPELVCLSDLPRVLNQVKLHA